MHSQCFKVHNEIYSIIAITWNNFLITVCPVKGQVRSECASHPSCHRTCTSTGPMACPAICIVNGCECPSGTVIDEAINECVPRRECEGTDYTNF